MNTEYIKKWLIKALNDIYLIKHEMAVPEKEIVTDGVCFHCQQAVEKLLKAFLISKNIDFGRTHELEILLALCIEQDEEFKNISIGNLTNYAVQIRYAEDFYIPSIEEAKESYKIALEVKNFVLRKLNIQEEELKE